MSDNFDPAYIGWDLLESVGVNEQGWYLLNDNFKVVAGPFANKKAAQDYSDDL
ncbi:hypothetical protein [Bradyrhizobium sp. LVM 105]|uniref:hypothetical protein n=1 Tax=Bradyrhizobium sp. LVM 105 TaxID=2341115 RepID=UPI0013DFE50A|nr:hypothetical protein [Bradyrhizobium sp. LVM 105]